MDIYSKAISKIIIFVIIVHVGVIVWISKGDRATQSSLKSPKQKLIVKTVSIQKQAEKIFPINTTKQPRKEAIAERKNKTESIKTAPLKSQKNVIQEGFKKSEKETVTKAFSQHKPIKKDVIENKPPKSRVNKSSKTLESIAKIQKNLDKGNFSKIKDSEIADLEEISVLNIDSTEIFAKSEAGYYNALLSCLKNNLILPELGEVKIKLTIDRNGKVLTIETLHAQSAWNKQYLESYLPVIVMPPFEQYYKGMNQKTFTITLINNN
jgi:CxxC motif-containing protein